MHSVSRPAWVLALLALCAGLAAAQPLRRDAIVVTGTAEPLPLEEVDRSVILLPVREWSLLANTLADFLRLDPSLDLRQRAPDGLQGDLSIRGASYGQTLVLLDGLRLNDVQTGHHNLDIPVPMEAVSRIEVLRGSGSTLYGSDAVGGAVNIITQPPQKGEVRLRGAAGNLGMHQQRASLGAASSGLSQQLVLGRDFSSGFRPGRDYQRLSLASLTHGASPWGPSRLLLAWDDRRFGADQFYGNFNSWESTKTWFASLRQAVGEKTQAGFAFRRHSDWFVLQRHRPADFANHHVVRSYQAALRRREALSGNADLHYGAEALLDSIASTNLGRHARQRAAAYASAEFRALRRYSLSLGAREEIHRRWSGQLSPTVSAGAWLSSRLKLRGSASRAFRVPTYTELYYHDPANRGSPDLRPEHAWSFEGGLDWHSGGKARASLAVFQRREKDGIDYVRASPTEVWRAANIQDLRFTGWEAALAIVPGRSHLLDFRYTGLAGAQSALLGLLSKYVFNYPSHSAAANWQASLPGEHLLRARLAVIERRSRDPYALCDLYWAWARGRVRPFLQLTNLTAARYEEVTGVAMPGRTLLGGLEILVFAGK